MQFRAAFRSLLLATSTRDGSPEASYAPYVTDQAGNLYVYVSALSRHTRNLQENPNVGLLFIEDEHVAKNIFARRRLTYVCRAERVEREGAEWTAVFALFTERFGGIMDLLRGLADFQLFRLMPRRGTYVRGFGEAFSFHGSDLREFRRARPGALKGEEGEIPDP